MGQNRTERNFEGSALSPLTSSASTCLPVQSRYYCRTIIVGREHLHAARASITFTHPERYMSIHADMLSAWRGLPLRCKKEAARPGPPLAPKNPVLMPVQSM